MKQFRRFLWALLLIGMAIAIYSSAVGETAPEKINWGGAEPAAGSWTRTADAMEFSYPMDAARDEPTILLRSAWQKYQVLVDGNVVYTASSERNGAFHLFRLPQGQELTVRFLDCAPGSGAESAVLQSQVYFGSRSGIQWMILRENLYAVLFSGFALVLGIACLLAAYCMQRQHFGNLYGSVYSLGAYILLAGVWVLTDSKILLLVSQKAGLVGLISYLSFYALHLPLLQFTIGVLPEKRRMLEILQAFYSGLLLLLMANFIFSLPLPECAGHGGTSAHDGDHRPDFVPRVPGDAPRQKQGAGPCHGRICAVCRMQHFDNHNLLSGQLTSLFPGVYAGHLRVHPAAG